MKTYSSSLRAEIVRKMSAYFSDPEEIDEEVKEIAKEVKKLVVQRIERKKLHATKEWLSEYWASLPWNKENTPLEDESWFVGWLDEVNSFGHQKFLYRCKNCNGTQEVSGSDLAMRCSSCSSKRKGEEFVGPNYCRRCNELFGACGASCPGRAHY